MLTIKTKNKKPTPLGSLILSSPSFSACHRDGLCEIPGPGIQVVKTNGTIGTGQGAILYRQLKDKVVDYKVLILSYNQALKKGGTKSAKTPLQV